MNGADIRGEMGIVNGSGVTKKAAPAKKVLVWPEGVNKHRVSATAASMFLIRDLITTPSEDMGPQHLEVRRFRCRLVRASRGGFEVSGVGRSRLLFR